MNRTNLCLLSCIVLTTVSLFPTIAFAQKEPTETEALAAIKYTISFVEKEAKEGVENGELKMSTEGMQGGEHFQKARAQLDQALKLAQMTNLASVDPSLFNQLVAQKLVFLIRTENFKLEDVLQIAGATDGKVPDDPIVSYLVGLALFRVGENSDPEKLYPQALAYFNRAIELRPEFPEALWLRSQIYAFQREPKLMKADFQSAKEALPHMNPFLFLYQMEIIEMIKGALADQTAK